MTVELFDQLHNWENLWQAYGSAARGKAPAARFECDLADNLLALQSELVDKSYRSVDRQILKGALARKTA